MRLGTAVKLTLSLIVAASLGIAAQAANRNDAANRATYLGSYTWRISADWFGGLSALSLSADGSSMTILSDRATLATAQINRDKGQISGIEIQSVHQLRASSGGALRGRTRDSEGLAIAPSGTIYISFEGISRVVRHHKASSRGEVLPRPKEFRSLPINKALEALASDARGHLYTLPEHALNSDGQIPVWHWDGRSWSTPFTLPPRGDFFPVSADIGPDGRFYLLERDYGLFGFRSRLRRWDFTKNGPVNEQILLQTSPGSHDNLEGLSVWRDPTGRLRATMISDDNFLILQRTELVEYALPD
ncbi:esterase-like activity of phytase family protein [Parasedimentitalea psychrophila]|uniref:Esterase-like activity of phytase family protein n=1 Tax=Parasedimentitalea psychrophila TaxID=2997337 RepID=A0A9Y2L2V2_9RHOB|nr:esterase-like activity of phytase family protein [Parasedimentitalea psychrophila]WIY26661.1 esterase-like activity of phytase family protein [Parasedimentitalea psychrophila]